MSLYARSLAAAATILLTAHGLLAQVRAPESGPTGSLQVFVTTLGPNVDSDGYVVALDDQSQSVGVNGSVAFTKVSPGTYTLTLLDIAENCSVEGSNPRAAVIAQDGVAEVRFEVICQAFGTTAQPSAQPRSTGNNRVGLWGGFGVGAGNLGCLESGCSDRIWGISGNARLGGTPSQSVRLAGGTNSFWRYEDGDTFTLGAVTFQILVFPGGKDFFFIFGGGFAYAWESYEDFTYTETGAGFLIGLGYDAPVSKSGNLAITPFVNWLPTTVSASFDFLQFGIGLTIN